MSSDAFIIRQFFISRSNAISLRINPSKEKIMTITTIMLTLKIMTMANSKIKIMMIRVSRKRRRNNNDVTSWELNWRQLGARWASPPAFMGGDVLETKCDVSLWCFLKSNTREHSIHYYNIFRKKCLKNVSKRPAMKLKIARQTKTFIYFIQFIVFLIFDRVRAHFILLRINKRVWWKD